MKVYVVVELWQGMFETEPSVYLSKKDAQRHFDEFVEKYQLDPDEPYDGDGTEIHMYETEIIKPRMVLTAHRRALARLEAICS